MSHGARPKKLLDSKVIMNRAQLRGQEVSADGRPAGKLLSTIHKQLQLEKNLLKDGQMI
jgi:hypothetical protein